MIPLTEYRVVYEFPLTLYSYLKNKMNEFMSVKKKMDEASKELDDHGYGDLIGGAVENLNELSKKLSVLEHFTAIHIDMADILLQKKVRNEALLCRDALADTEDITRTTDNRIAFETQLDAVYREQLAAITRLDSDTTDRDNVEECILWRVKRCAIYIRDRLGCIRTFSKKLEKMLGEEDGDSVEAVWQVMEVRHPEAFETFRSWMQWASSRYANVDCGS
jgi:hypothetical protein